MVECLQYFLHTRHVQTNRTPARALATAPIFLEFIQTHPPTPVSLDNNQIPQQLSIIQQVMPQCYLRKQNNPGFLYMPLGTRREGKAGKSQFRLLWFFFLFFGKNYFSSSWIFEWMPVTKDSKNHLQPSSKEEKTIFLVNWTVPSLISSHGSVHYTASMCNLTKSLEWNRIRSPSCCLNTHYKNIPHKRNIFFCGFFLSVAYDFHFLMHYRILLQLIML